MYSRTFGDPAEGNHQCPSLIYAVGPWARLFKYTCSHVLYMCIIKRATYTFARGTLACFQTFGHDVLNIVHVSIGGFAICVEQCSTMRCLAGTAQYLLNCIMRANNGL